MKSFWNMITSGEREMAKDELKTLGYPERKRGERLGRAITAGNLPRVSGWIYPERPTPPKIEISD